MLLPLSIYIVLKVPAIKNKAKSMQEVICLLLRKKNPVFVDGMVVFLEIARERLKNF